ncbi:unnamed protein product, partial [Prorocentrum cordatum]
RLRGRAAAAGGGARREPAGPRPARPAGPRRRAGGADRVVARGRGASGGAVLRRNGGVGGAVAAGGRAVLPVAAQGRCPAVGHQGAGAPQQEGRHLGDRHLRLHPGERRGLRRQARQEAEGGRAPLHPSAAPAPEVCGARAPAARRPHGAAAASRPADADARRRRRGRARRPPPPAR